MATKKSRKGRRERKRAQPRTPPAEEARTAEPLPGPTLADLTPGPKDIDDDAFDIGPGLGSGNPAPMIRTVDA